MNDLEIFIVMASACEMFADYAVVDIRNLLGQFEASRFERLMGRAFPLEEARWLALSGDEAATAVGLVAAMVDAGDLPR